jgi:hypothetical protein
MSGEGNLEIFVSCVCRAFINVLIPIQCGDDSTLERTSM